MTLSTLVAIAALAVTTSALTIGTLIARRQPTPADQLAARRTNPPHQPDSGEAA